MSCQNSCNNESNCTQNNSYQSNRSGSGFVFIVVLYILLAIIIGSNIY